MGNVLLTPLLPIMHCIGFTARGVARGSLAAAIHSFHGIVHAGSYFAQCQSAAASSSPCGCALVTIFWVILFYCLIMWLCGYSIWAPFVAFWALLSGSCQWLWSVVSGSFQWLWSVVSGWFQWLWSAMTSWWPFGNEGDNATNISTSTIGPSTFNLSNHNLSLEHDSKSANQTWLSILTPYFNMSNYNLSHYYLVD